jgi:hypothetical protein
VSNGLDARTTFDIFNAIKYVSRILGTTICVSLLQVSLLILLLSVCLSVCLLNFCCCPVPPQPAPEVFNLFDEVILMSEGQIIYHGLFSSLVCLTSLFFDRTYNRGDVLFQQSRIRLPLVDRSG